MPRLKQEQVTVIVDTREQLPFNLSPLKMEEGSLPTGDYTVRGLEGRVCLERKSVDDLIGCMVGDINKPNSPRYRFKRELQRMNAYAYRAIIVEGSWPEVMAGQYKSNLHVNSVEGMITTWTGEYGVSFFFAGNRSLAQSWARLFLFHAARKHLAMLEGIRS